MTNVIALLLLLPREASARHGHAQERGGDRRRGLAAALVLAVEQSFQFLLQVSRLAALLGGIERIHARTIVSPELGDEAFRRARIVEHVGIPREGYPLLRHARRAEPLRHIALDAPRHRADKAFGWRWRVGGADLEDLRDQGGIAGNPV